MVDGPGKSSLRPLICIGAAYFVVAVIFPTVVLRTKGEKGKWTFSGVIWSLAGGACGTLGALGIIIAFKFGGQPVYVMPLVFGCAPVVNMFVTMIMARTLKAASIPFYIGVVVVAIGAAGVMYNKPTIKHDDDHSNAAKSETEYSESTDGEEVEVTQSRERIANSLMIAFGIALTASCWGSYGPVLHKGQAKMAGSRLRPYFCVGIAYFFLAVILPTALMPVFNESPQWTVPGTLFSMLAGTFGAFGALGIIYAFNFGGKPIMVMPLIFGMAPVINTFTVITSNSLWGQISIGFYISLFLVIAGAITVLRMAPKGGPPKKVLDSTGDKTTPLDTVRIENERPGFGSHHADQESHSDHQSKTVEIDPDEQ